MRCPLSKTVECPEVSKRMVTIGVLEEQIASLKHENSTLHRKLRAYDDGKHDTHPVLSPIEDKTRGHHV